jgi:hypothetical protein
MKKTIAALIGMLLSGLTMTAHAQEAKPYKEGMVTDVSYIKIKTGRFDDYMRFLSTSYKANMEAQKKAGLIVGYNIYSVQAKSPREPDIILTTTYTNMAALDRTDDFDAVSVKAIGPTAAQNKAAMDRDAMREVLGSERMRELVLK